MYRLLPLFGHVEWYYQADVNFFVGWKLMIATRTLAERQRVIRLHSFAWPRRCCQPTKMLTPPPRYVSSTLSVQKCPHSKFHRPLYGPWFRPMTLTFNARRASAVAKYEPFK